MNKLKNSNIKNLGIKECEEFIDIIPEDFFQKTKNEEMKLERITWYNSSVKRLELFNGQALERHIRQIYEGLEDTYIYILKSKYGYLIKTTGFDPDEEGEEVNNEWFLAC